MTGYTTGMLDRPTPIRPGGDVPLTFLVPRATASGMKLYLLYRCPMAHRATIVLQEKKLAFEAIFFKVGQRPSELEAVGPNAKSPTLFDGATRVYDSQIVVEYLEDRYRTPSFMPTEAAQRAEVRMLASGVNQELLAPFGSMVPEFRKPPEQRDQAKMTQAKAGLLDALRSWDQRLAGRTFLVGDSLSLADVILYTPLDAARRELAVEFPAELPHIKAWYDRMAARPTTKLLEPIGASA
jgi:glutathione S-transferase